MKQISSKSADIVKAVKRLRQKRHRDRTGLFVAEGYHLLQEAVKCRIKIEFVFFTEDASRRESSAALIRELEKERVPLYVTSEDVFDTMALTESPQGVLTVCRRPVFDAGEILSVAGANYLVLDRVQDPGNVGTMIRTALAAGYEGVFVMKGSADIYSDKVVRSAAGSVFRMPISYFDDPAELLDALKAAGKKTIVATADAKTRYYEASFKEDAALVIGNEAGGVCEFFKENASCKVSIPMEGETESLNAAVAAGILLYENMRCSQNHD